jgi:hypothetical protein
VLRKVRGILNTSLVNALAGEPFFFFAFWPPGLVIDLETLYHILERGGTRRLDVEITRSEYVSDGSIE